MLKRLLVTSLLAATALSGALVFAQAADAARAPTASESMAIRQAATTFLRYQPGFTQPRPWKIVSHPICVSTINSQYAASTEWGVPVMQSQPLWMYFKLFRGRWNVIGLEQGGGAVIAPKIPRRVRGEFNRGTCVLNPDDVASAVRRHAAAIDVVASGVATGTVAVAAIKQRPYRPLTIVMDVRYPIQKLVWVGYEIRDAAGVLVYRSRKGQSDSWFGRQKYGAALVDVSWRKVGLDGLPAPVGKRYFVTPILTPYREDSAGYGPIDKASVRGSRRGFVLR